MQGGDVLGIKKNPFKKFWLRSYHNDYSAIYI